MTMLDSGLNRLRDLHNTDLTYGVCGTSPSIVSFSDLVLVYPDISSDSTVTKDVSDKAMQVTFTLPSNVGNGNVYYEWSLKNGSGITSSATHYTRTLTAGVNKNASIEVSRITTFYYDRE